MSATTSSSNLTSGFIDLATYDELEKYMYGGEQAVSYFVRKVRKATWFTVVPVVLSKSAGVPNFNQQWSANISRAGDYLLRSFLRITFPSVQLSPNNRNGNAGAIRYTRNLMHALIREASISFNDLVEMRFDNYYLDFWAQFAIPAGKRNGYNNMVGNIAELTDPVAVGGGQASSVPSLPQVTLNLPLPLCHSRDSGVALPTAALPYNEMRLNFNFRDYTDLIILDNMDTQTSVPVVASDLTSVPTLSQVDVWAEYAIVSNNERKQMGQAPRDILIEQVQTVPTTTFNPSTNALLSTDIRLSHAVKCLFFAVRNTTNSAEWSNYTCASPVPSHNGLNTSPNFAVDPVNTASLLYENTQRLSNMGADYFSLVNPYYNAVSIPTETGYHMYSYSLDLMSVNPMGSTNFGKLTNVSLQITPSTTASNVASIASGDTQYTVDGANTAQQFAFVMVAVNHNIVRCAGGALGSKCFNLVCALYILYFLQCIYITKLVEMMGKPRIGGCNQSYGNTLVDKQYNFRSTNLPLFVDI